MHAVTGDGGGSGRVDLHVAKYLAGDIKKLAGGIKILAGDIKNSAGDVSAGGRLDVANSRDVTCLHDHSESVRRRRRRVGRRRRRDASSSMSVGGGP